MRVVKFLLNLLGWLQVVLGTTIAGALTGLGIIYFFDGGAAAVVAIILTGLGCVAGIFWATRIWIKHGTVDWLSRTRRIS